jgi:hypothetical protein
MKTMYTGTENNRSPTRRPKSLTNSRTGHVTSESFTLQTMAPVLCFKVKIKTTFEKLVHKFVKPFLPGLTKVGVSLTVVPEDRDRSCSVDWLFHFKFYIRNDGHCPRSRIYSLVRTPTDISLICDNSVTTTTVSQPQQCHNHNSVTTTAVLQPQQCHNHNSVTTTTVLQPQQCHNYNSVTTTAVSQLQQCHNHSSVTTTAVSQLQQCHNHSSVTTTEVSQPQQCHNYNSVTNLNL